MNPREPVTMDLGTWHVRAKFADGRGFIMPWSTGCRYIGGPNEIQPLDAKRLAPIYHSVDELRDEVRGMFIDGNYSCDCNRKSFLAAASGLSGNDYNCGDELLLVSLFAIAPNGVELELLSEEEQHEGC